LTKENQNSKEKADEDLQNHPIQKGVEKAKEGRVVPLVNPAATNLLEPVEGAVEEDKFPANYGMVFDFYVQK
jgi:hypothetical protein